mgnify:FL=1
MPIKHAAVRQIRKDRARTARNQALRSQLRTLEKRFSTLLAQQKQGEAARLLPLVIRRFDQAAAKGILHKNTASRTKSQLMRRLPPGAATKAAPQTPAGTA